MTGSPLVRSGPVTAGRTWFGGLAPRDRRALRLGLLVLGPALLWSAIVKPYAHAWSERRGRVEQERDLLRRELALLADAAHYEPRLQQAGQALLADAPRLFTGTDTVETASLVSSYVSDLAMRHRVFVQASEPRGTTAAGEGMIGISVEVRAVGDLDGVLAWLHALETGDKLVRVGSLAVAPAERPGGTGTPGEEVLGIALAVTGYALTSGDAPSASGPVDGAEAR